MTALPYGAREARNLSQSRQVGVDDFVAAGIDDLAKYRIVQLLCCRPDTCWDAAEYAERLGLRPIERTEAELDELVEQHLLEKQGDGGRPQYKLTSDRKLRGNTFRLFSRAPAEMRDDHILARLAFGSLERARREAKRNKRGRRPSSQSVREVPQELTRESRVPISSQNDRSNSRTHRAS